MRWRAPPAGTQERSNVAVRASPRGSVWAMRTTPVNPDVYEERVSRRRGRGARVSRAADGHRHAVGLQTGEASGEGRARGVVGSFEVDLEPGSRPSTTRILLDLLERVGCEATHAHDASRVVHDARLQEPGARGERTGARGPDH